MRTAPAEFPGRSLSRRNQPEQVVSAFRDVLEPPFQPLLESRGLPRAGVVMANGLEVRIGEGGDLPFQPARPTGSMNVSEPMSTGVWADPFFVIV
jgi:hypothetical protein